MPAAGNHENELGNGPIGYSAYQAYFALPDSGSDPELRGLWYAFTAGSVRVVSLQNDDICYQDGGTSYVRGYSGGRQKAWLEAELERTRSNPEIDWTVVCMHQTAISTGNGTNGADLGIRENWRNGDSIEPTVLSGAAMPRTVARGRGRFRDGAQITVPCRGRGAVVGLSRSGKPLRFRCIRRRTRRPRRFDVHRRDLLRGHRSIRTGHTG
jgi:3',5'-cyclic AMP phosphodiesterase CpdA